MTNYRNYEITDFKNDAVNIQIFEKEIDALGLSVNRTHTNTDELFGVTNVRPYFDGDLSSGDESALDNLVANDHDGEDFSSPPFQYTDEEGGDDDSGDEVDIGSVSNIMPEPGDYKLNAGAEVAMTTTTGTQIAKWRFYVTKNGNEVERQEGHNDQHLWQPLLCAYPFNVKAGDVFSFRMTMERQGPSGNAAKYQRVRIRIKKDL